MSEAMPEPGGRRILGLRPRTALIAGGVILAAALGYFLWKRKQSSSSGAASASASSSTAGAYGVDYGGELSVIQSELEGLMAAEGQEPAASGGGTGTGGGTGSGKIPPTYKPPVSSGGDNDSGGGGTKTTVKPKPGIPAGVHAVRTGSSAVTLAWDKAPNATSYRVRVTYQGRLVGSPHVVAGTSATISGLHPDHTYTFHVAAVGPGGTSAETGGPSVKTTR